MRSTEDYAFPMAYSPQICFAIWYQFIRVLSILDTQASPPSLAIRQIIISNGV
jgi:hypothetical protein